VDRPLAKVRRDLGPRVVGAECLLVDVLLEDVAEDVGIDLVGVAAWCVVEVPRVRPEQLEEIGEGLVGDGDIRVLLLDRMLEKESTVEIPDVAEEALRLGRALVRRLGEALEEKHAQKLGVIAVFATASALFEFALEVVEVPTVEESFALQEPDEHQAIEQDRGVPAAIALVVDAGDEVEELEVLLLELAVELLRDFLDVEAELEAPRDFEHLRIAFLEVGDVEEQRRHFADEEIAGLATEERVRARQLLAILPLDPEPLAARPFFVDEEEQILVPRFGDFAMDRKTLPRAGNLAIRRRHLIDEHAREMRDWFGRVADAFDLRLDSLLRAGL
jgi:hypothetical protein